MSKTLPIIPMRTGVLFPNVSLPITAGRAATLRALEVAMRDPAHRVFVVAQRDDADEVLPEGLYTVGTIAKVSAVQRGNNGARLVLEGEERGIAIRVSSKDGYLEATVTTAVDLPPLDVKDAAFIALHREVRERAAELAQKRGISNAATAQLLSSIIEPGALADVIGGYLDAPTAERQGVLEELGVEDRLRRVLIMMQRQIEVLAAQEDIHTKVQEEIGGRQREHYLREQMKAIQKELGEGDDASNEALGELKDKLEKLPLPKPGKRSIASSPASRAQVASPWSRR